MLSILLQPLGAAVALLLLALLRRRHRDRWVWIGLALVGAEVLVLVLFRLACPLTVVARRYSASQAPNFDIYLPAWIARYNKLIYGAIMVVVVVGLVWRLL